MPPQDSPRAGICRGTESPCGTPRMFRFRNPRSTLNLIRAMALQSSVESSRTFGGPMPKGALRAPLCPPTYPQKMTREEMQEAGKNRGKILVPSASEASHGRGKSWEGLDGFGSRPSAVHPCRLPLATAGPPGGVHRAEVASRRREGRGVGQCARRVKRPVTAVCAPEATVTHLCRTGKSAIIAVSI